MKENIILRYLDKLHLPEGKIKDSGLIKNVKMIAGLIFTLAITYGISWIITNLCGKGNLSPYLFAYFIFLLISYNIFPAFEFSDKNILEGYEKNIGKKIYFLIIGILLLISVICAYYAADKKVLDTIMFTLILIPIDLLISMIYIQLMRVSLIIYTLSNVIVFVVNFLFIKALILDKISSVLFTIFVILIIYVVGSTNKEPDAVVKRSDGKTSEIFLSEELKNQFKNTGR